MRLTIQGLQPNTPYAAQVRATDKNGKVSAWSQKYTFTTTSNSATPAAPTGVTWVVVGDAFAATWNEVTQDINSTAAVITAYELEMVPSVGLTKIVTVPAQRGMDGNYTLTFADNVALFGTPKPNITLRVRAVNNKNVKGAYSTGVNAVNPPPANVTGFTAQGIQDGVSMSWTANTDDDLIGYEVFTGATSGFTPSSANKIFSGNVTDFTYTTTTYSLQWFKIHAVDKFFQPSAADASASATPISPYLVDVTAPPTPTALAGTITNNGNGIGASAALTWTMSSPPSDLAGFNVRYRKVGATAYLYASGIDSGDRATTIPLDTAYQNYEFQIQAFDFSSNASAWSSTVTVTSPANTAPANVTGLTSVAGNNNIIYSWTAVADLDIKNYEVTFSTSPTFASGNITYFTGTSTTLTVGGLSYGTTYYARVRAVDNGGLTSVAWSATDTKATGSAPGTSDGLAPTSSPTPTVAGALGYLFVTWTPITNNDPVTYEVHVSTTTGFTPSGATKAAEISGSYAALENDGSGAALAYGTTYYVKLIAKDKDGAAAASAQASGNISQVGVADVGTGAITTNALAANSVIANKLNVVMGGGNLIPDSSFESTGNNQAGWVINTGTGVKDTAQKWTGTKAFKVVAGGENWGYYPPDGGTIESSGTNKPAVVAGTTYTASIYVYSSTAQNLALIQYGTGATQGPTVAVAANTWTRLTCTFVAPASNCFLSVRDPARVANIGTVWLDAFQLEIGDVPTAYAPMTNEILPGTISSVFMRADFISGQTYTVGTGGAIQSSSYSAGSAGFKISTTGIEMNDANSAIKVEALRAGTIGGVSGAGAINVAAGTSIIMNGGYLKSNTYTGTTQATNPSGAGFYLGNDGIRIDQGIVSASAFAGGTFTGGNFVVGSGGSITSTGFTLNNSGLTVTSGTISAAALQIQSGVNLLPRQYSDFEFNSAYYTANIVLFASSFTIDTTDKRFNTQSLKWVPGSTFNTIQLSASSTDFNMSLPPGNYIVSYYAMIKTGATAISIQPILAYQTTSSPGTVGGTNQAIPANSTWARYSTVITIPAASTGLGYLYFFNTAAGTVYLDGIQVEEQMSGSTTPSVWKPSTTETIIDGGLIKTGSIISTATTVVNSTTIPVWSIPLNGSASFANLQVRGNAVIGVPSGTDGGASQLASGNYVAGTTGWVIRSDGYAEFRNVFIGADSTNLVLDSNMEGSGSWGLGTGWAFGVAGGAMAAGDNNGKVLRFNATGTYQQCIEPQFKVNPGEVLRVEYQIRRAAGTVAPAGNIGVFVFVNDSTGTNIGTPGIDTAVPSELTTLNWVTKAADITVPANGVMGTVVVRATAGVTSGTYEVDVVTVRRKITGNLLVNGAITSGSQNPVVISTVANPFQANSNWGVIQFYADAGSGLWPGQIWSNYTSSRSYLSLTSPYVNTNGPTSSARLNLSTDASSATIAELIAAQVTLSANNMYLNSTNSSQFDVNLFNTNVLSIRQALPGVQWFVIDLGTLNETKIRARTSTGTDIRMHVTGSDMLLDVTQGQLLVWGNANTQGAIGANGSGGAIVFTNASVVAGTWAYNAASPTASNTVTFHAAAIHSWTGGIFMEDLVQATSTTATINTNGRIIRTTSSVRYKDDIKPMDLKVARQALALEAVTYKLKDEAHIKKRRNYPGFTAEQAHDAGAALWVNYDNKGRPDGFRYDQLTVAHNMLIKDLYSQIEDLKTQVAALRS